MLNNSTVNILTPPPRTIEERSFQKNYKKSPRLRPKRQIMDANTNLPPLAEYFWIAGIDSISYGEHMPPEPPRIGFAEGLIEAAEPDEDENDARYQRRSNGTLQPESRSQSPNRLSPSPNLTPTGEGRLSVASQNSGKLGIRSSNSSTSTLANSLKVGMSDADFDKALFKFAAERESFLEDLSFSAGTIVHNKPVVHPRAQKVINDDLSKAGSIRRRISLRDLSSMRRAPSVVGRAGMSRCCAAYTYGRFLI